MIYALPYVVCFSLLVLGSIPVCRHLSYKRINYTNIVPYSLVFFALTFFLGGRAFIYSDCFSYYDYYRGLPTLLEDKFIEFLKMAHWEKGFVLFMIVMKTICRNYFFFQMVSFLIDYVMLFYLFKYYNPEKILLSFAFFFPFLLIAEVNLMRNAKAIYLFFISLKYIERRDVKKFFLFNIIGCFFHVSAIFYFPFYIILNKKFSKRTLLILFVLGNMFYVFRITWIQRLLMPFVGVSTIGILSKLSHLNSDFSRDIGISVAWMERTFTFMILYLQYIKLEKTDKKHIIVFNCLFAYLFIYLFLSEMQIFVDRLTVLFVLSYCIFYPNLYKKCSRSTKCIFVVLFLLYCSLKLIALNGYYYMSYENIFLPHGTYSERYQNNFSLKR